jgi:hypothetical protein
VIRAIGLLSLFQATVSGRVLTFFAAVVEQPIKLRRPRIVLHFGVDARLNLYARCTATRRAIRERTAWLAFRIPLVIVVGVVGTRPLWATWMRPIICVSKLILVIPCARWIETVIARTGMNPLVTASAWIAPKIDSTLQSGEIYPINWVVGNKSVEINSATFSNRIPI